METNKRIRILTIFLIVLSGLAAMIVFAAYGQYKSIMRSPMSAFVLDKQSTAPSAQIAASQIADAGSGVPAKPTSAEDITYSGKAYSPNKNVVNILLLGIDWDATRTDMGWRSDMNMLCSVDFAHNTMTLTAIPRDTRAKVYYINMENGSIKNADTDKINAAYSYGGGPDKYGAQNAMRCISEFLSQKGKYNVPIDYYISIDLQGIPKFASALGGIKVELDVNFPGIGKKGDTVVLNEDNSRAFLENRKLVGGELVRISHEQDYLMAIAQKIKENGAVSSAPSLYTNLMKFMHTNLTLEQIIALAKVLDNISTENITLQTIEGDFDVIDDIDFFIADSKDVESKVVSFMYEASPGQ